MKARFSYPLICLPLSAMSAGVVAIVFVACAAGVMWIFVYGDNEWPAAAERTVMALSVLIFAAILALILVALYKFGKEQESRGGLTKKHALVAVIATLLLPMLILIRQWSIGAIGSHNPYAVPAAAVGDG
jgi:cytochrome bd-type quinol oxidase subunit 2